MAWVVGLIAVRGRTMSRGGGWVWALPVGCALVGLSWLAPQGFALALVYVHPLVALWFLDRQLRLSRPGWSRAYRLCLALLPVALAVLWWRLAGAAPLAEDGEVALRIVRHAGAGIVPDVSTHLLVSTHVFLETLHYGVWLVGVPLAAGAGLAPWRAATVPLVRHRRGWPRLIRALLVAGGLIVLLLWLCFAGRLRDDARHLLHRRDGARAGRGALPPADALSLTARETDGPERRRPLALPAVRLPLHGGRRDARPRPLPL